MDQSQFANSFGTLVTTAGLHPWIDLCVFEYFDDIIVNSPVRSSGVCLGNRTAKHDTQTG